MQSSKILLRIFTISPKKKNSIYIIILLKSTDFKNPSPILDSINKTPQISLNDLAKISSLNIKRLRPIIGMHLFHSKEGVMKRLNLLMIALFTFGNIPSLMAKVTISPFVSISSTKKIKPEAKGKEREEINEKRTYGIRGALSIYRIFKLEASVGQAKSLKTTKTQDAVDDYKEIDYQKDLNMDTSSADKETRLSETQNKARAGVALDPSFSIFILRAAVGAQATQRHLKSEVVGETPKEYTSPITYKPYAGAGAGIKFTPRTFFMAEYNFLLYKFPKYTPFEREVTVSFGVSI